MDAKNSASGNNRGKKNSIADADSPLWQNRIHLVYDREWGGEAPVTTADQDFSDLLLEAANIEEKLAWLAAIQAHTNYTETMLTSPFMMEQSNAATVDRTANFLTTEAQNSAKSTKSDTPTATEPATAAPAQNGRSLSATPPKRSTLLAQVADTRSKSIVGSRASVNTNAHRTSYSNFDDDKRWMVFLNPGEELKYCGLTGKPNPVGIQHPRQLLLTSRKRFVYVDPKSLEVKGEIQWNSRDYDVKRVDNFTFEIMDGKRAFKFIAKDGLTADQWINAINSVVIA